MKLKPILPSLREKKRYIAFEVKTEENVDFNEVKTAIESAMKGFLGDLGMAHAGAIFLPDWKNNHGIVRVNSNMVDHTKASLALVTHIAGQKATVHSVAVSGVINKLRI
ncbi:MAG TPA: Rpp14/Pop5 family protein [Candidatus Nanoarchaeia archaeon]|nr:Rpp14/Pop5 family protein [Candidatus Nanoarchaeia archaeon]